LRDAIEQVGTFKRVPTRADLTQAKCAQILAGFLLKLLYLGLFLGVMLCIYIPFTVLCTLNWCKNDKNSFEKPFTSLQSELIWFKHKIHCCYGGC